MSEDPQPKSVQRLEADTSSSEDERGCEVAVESLVAGRSKRVTAGNRLSSLLEKEADDELELLFAEDEEEEDVEFEGEDGDDASDAQLDSSSDDEDQGPAPVGDDLEGEKELQQQDKAERQKKRKAQEIYKRPPALKSNVKMGPAAASGPVTPATRAKKKSERVSWLPTPDEGPVRSSSRKQTIQNKEVVHQRMQENEKRRRRQISVMEAAAKRKEAAKAKVMTQADRMAEAARTEKRNAKSLNKWEETEQKRVEEQKARLAALQNRQLQGPVITWWSGPSKWIDGTLAAVGAKHLDEGNQTTIRVEELTVRPVSQSTPLLTDHKDPPDVMMTDAISVSQPQAPTISSDTTTPSMPPPASQLFSAPVQAAPAFLDGIHYYAALPQYQQSETGPTTGHQPGQVEQSAPVSEIPLSITEYSARNLIILENIDGNATRLPELHNHILLRKKTPKLQKATHEMCAITGHPARFRDPKTGLPYANSYAYKEIQKLCSGGSRWSSLLGCYVGPVASAARGVPDQFYKST
ncbi:hypothetical protein MMC26_005668 [Xylographa opegraphella]|nr:hypothetical protein [Xylographa opegraphella]